MEFARDFMKCLHLRCEYRLVKGFPEDILFCVKCGMAIRTRSGTTIMRLLESKPSKPQTKPLFTKKHYEFIGKAVRRAIAGNYVDVVDMLVHEFSLDNENFDQELFYEFCGLVPKSKWPKQTTEVN